MPRDDIVVVIRQAVARDVYAKGVLVEPGAGGGGMLHETVGHAPLEVQDDLLGYGSWLGRNIGSGLNGRCHVVNARHCAEHETLDAEEIGLDLHELVYAGLGHGCRVVVC